MTSSNNEVLLFFTLLILIDNLTQNENKMKEKYWKKNIMYLRILLSIWFISSFGLGILFAENLNSIFLGGFPLGFWFAQQGSIYVFVIIIFIYVYLMNKLDKEHDLEE